MPIWLGSSVAMVVAAQSRNRCGLIGTPSSLRVQPVIAWWTIWPAIGLPHRPIHNIGEVLRPSSRGR